jgi:small subunit ribosomal protein S19
MSRSLWKGPFCEININSISGSPIFDGKQSHSGQGLIKHTPYGGVTKLSRTKNPKIWSRRSTILPQFVGSSFSIYNGKNFISLNISQEMIGHKFGEFATTRKKPIHKKKK